MAEYFYVRAMLIAPSTLPTAMRREEEWAKSGPDLDAYAKSACTQTIHHKPVYVTGVYNPPLKAPSVKVRLRDRRPRWNRATRFPQLLPLS